MTRRQSNNQWSGGIASHTAPPQKFRVQISAGKVLISIFGLKTACSSLTIFQRAKLSTRSITHLWWCRQRTFWRKNAAGSSPRGSSSCTKMSLLTDHRRPRRNWLIWASNVLITHSIHRIWPRRTTTCFLDWKKQLKVRHFSSDPEVIAAAETWLDGQHCEFFFWVACKSQSNGLKSVLSFVGSMLNNSGVCSLQLVSFLVGIKTYQHPRVCNVSY